MADIARPRMLPTHDSLRDLEGILEDSRDLGQFLGSRVFVTSKGSITISCVASNASRRGVGQWGGAGGAVCEDHLAFCGELLGFAGRLHSA